MSQLFHAQNIDYVERLYHSFLSHPESVSAEWGVYFTSPDFLKDITLDEGARANVEAGRSKNAQIFPQNSTQTTPQDNGIFFQPSTKNSSQSPSSSPQSYEIRDSIRALMLIRSYRVRGHLYANLDPLGLDVRARQLELEPSFYGFLEDDMDRPICLDGVLGFESATMTQIIGRLRATYASTVGVEYMHIQDPIRKNWIEEFMDVTPFTLSVVQKKGILKNLVRAELFENFLHKKFQGAKRFGLDGGESLIPALEHTLSEMASLGVSDIVVGMAHRGRLSVLTNIIGKPYRHLFAKFLNSTEDPFQIGSGDVKYHLGYSGDRVYEEGGRTKKLHLSLMSNPSHLEAVDPVVLGKVRAEQAHIQDVERKKIVGILMHGDAAFAGQGLVAETLDLSDLNGYRTGGTLHIVINNQIGFTTSPPHSRSSPYCTDIAKGIQSPIFHVNADDPEAVLRVFDLALRYRHEFQQDVVVDMICYRRFGHNESDEPSFTQPLMYKAIAEHPSTSRIYEKSLLSRGIVTEEEASTVREDVQSYLESEYQKAVTGEDCFEHPHWLTGLWQGMNPGDMGEVSGSIPITGVEKDTLQKVGQTLTHVPENFHINPKIQRQLKLKEKMLAQDQIQRPGVDWGTAEALAFGTLLYEGYGVRLSGQDCGRGTFSHRHAVLVDQENEEKYIPLAHVSKHLTNGTAHHQLCEIVDSPLAEASVLGFEYGYSGASPHNLVLWEGQFGDFANGAQVIIDQFIASGEMKWSRQNGLVMLLPHGFEGQGPEHSSARLERFLQLCGDGNWYVANCSTPANYFHILRRQMKQNYRKPLILMTPKSLLRHKLCVSDLSEMMEGTSFQPVYGEKREHIKPAKVSKVVLCSGKVYYDLLAHTLEHKETHVALIRLEQFYPFPEKELVEALKSFKSANFYWCQEEPENMGAWHFIDRRLEKVLIQTGARFSRPELIARKIAASPATGIPTRHTQEQDALLKGVFEEIKRPTLSAMK